MYACVRVLCVIVCTCVHQGYIFGCQKGVYPFTKWPTRHESPISAGVDFMSAVHSCTTSEISVIETIMEMEIIDPALAETETMVIFETAVT